MIKETRKKKKISQEKLAKLAKVDRSALSYIETGKSCPSLRTLQKLAKALGVKVSELLEEE